MSGSMSCFGAVKKQKMNGHANNHHYSNSNCPAQHQNGMANGGGGGSSHDHFDHSLCTPAICHIQSGHHQNGAMSNGLGKASSKVVNVEMVSYCFDVLRSHLHGSDPPAKPKFPNHQYPLFVTWKVGKDLKLRGCIGTFNNTQLHHGLREYAVTSAFKDSRFDPIGADELVRLHCSVSLLTDFEPTEHYLDWQIGVHGIRIEFSSERGSKKAATYLPEVAVEQNWSHVQTIDSLMRKGGYKGNITQDVRAQIVVVRFQSDKMTVSYNEYIHYKQNANNPRNTRMGLGRGAASACGSTPALHHSHLEHGDRETSSGDNRDRPQPYMNMNTRSHRDTRGLLHPMPSSSNSATDHHSPNMNRKHTYNGYRD